MDRDALLKQMKPLVDAFSGELATILSDHFGKARTRALDLAKKQMRAELEEADARSEPRRKRRVDRNSTRRALPRARARKPVPTKRVEREPTVARGRDRDAPERGEARGQAGGEPPSSGRRCRKCGELGHKANNSKIHPPGETAEVAPPRASAVASSLADRAPQSLPPQGSDPGAARREAIRARAAAADNKPPPPPTKLDRFAAIEAAAERRRGALQ
jgi:hypothetical protein